MIELNKAFVLNTREYLYSVWAWMQVTLSQNRWLVHTSHTTCQPARFWYFCSWCVRQI